MKNAVFWDVVLVATNIVPSMLILLILMTEAIRSTETSVLTKATRHHILEDGILYNGLTSGGADIALLSQVITTAMSVLWTASVV
jgi:hypothetical protein